MTPKLTWLHISDIHFNPKNEWCDSTARESLIEYLKEIFEKDESLRPDLVFCTGDIAFGELSDTTLSEQYKSAKEFFDALLAICGSKGEQLPKECLFVVPGNHDINRKSINSHAQKALHEFSESPLNHSATINQQFNTFSIEIKDAFTRLNEYGIFIQEYLPHQVDKDGRFVYICKKVINDLTVGIAGLNSAWSCAGPEDDRHIWLAAEWQFNKTRSLLRDCNVRFCLLHHPVDWLNETEQSIATHRITTNFDFFLHGHSHNAWVAPSQSNITIAAGAVGAKAPEEFGINIVNIDLAESKGIVHLHNYKPQDGDWTIAPVAKLAPTGQWSFNLPTYLCKALPTTHIASASLIPVPAKRTPRLFGRNTLIKDCNAKLVRQPFLLIYGLRGNGKSALIDALLQEAPLAGKELLRCEVSPQTTVNELFRQVATLLGETAEFPKTPEGSPAEIATEIKRRYPNARPACLWIDRAHHLLDSKGFRHPEIRNLLLGIKDAVGSKWHWVFEMRERPSQNLLGPDAYACEVLGLNKDNLAECLADATPVGHENSWSITGTQLTHIYQWLGGGHGNHAHPQAIQLLIEVARGHNETPYEMLLRHREDVQQRVEEVLLGDLYHNVLSASEQKMLLALSLYRSAIPHDHADSLERYLSIPNSWDGLDRRCLLSFSGDHSHYYLHSFIASWLRTRMLKYKGEGESDEIDFTDTASNKTEQYARSLHSAIATCWLDQLGSSTRATNINIERAMEAFHHLVASGEVKHLQTIAIKLLSGNKDWAREHICRLYEHLFKSKAPIEKQRKALEYAEILDPDNHMVQRFLGECWQKEEGEKSSRAMACFENACRLDPDFPPYLANLGRALLAHGPNGASKFLNTLKIVEKDHPQAIDDHVLAIQYNCLGLTGDKKGASILRMAKINGNSKDAVFFNDEANSRMESGDTKGALEIIDLCEKNRCADEFTANIRRKLAKTCNK